MTNIVISRKALAKVTGRTLAAIHRAVARGKLIEGHVVVSKQVYSGITLDSAKAHWNWSDQVFEDVKRIWGPSVESTDNTFLDDSPWLPKVKDASSDE